MSDHFNDPDAVARYAEGPRRQVPGLDAAHRMTAQLLAEHVPSDGGRVLVVGAGGGLEIAALAEVHEGWRFDGVDPSAEMLKLAAATTAGVADRVTLREGYVDAAPDGPYDGATCLLVLHFVEREERLRTLREIRRRLRPGAPLVTLHHSVPGGDERLRWLERSVRFGGGGAVDREREQRSAAEMERRLPLLTPEQDEALLREAGFSEVGLFYAALTFRGWVAHR